MTVSMDTHAARIRFVLVNTSHPGNIGGAARAMRTMGLSRLCLVTPHQFPDPQASAMAAGADALLEAAVITPDLPTAIADCSFVIGATARHRGVPMPEMDPRTMASRVRDVVAQGGEIAIVFGNERTGLENDELSCCHAAVMIPTSAEFSSLNLAQAVQVLAYELRLALTAEQAQTPDTVSVADPPATNEQLELFFAHLEQTLEDIDFHKGRSTRTIMQRLRRLFLRARMDQREVRIMRGIFGEAQRMARLARDK